MFMRSLMSVLAIALLNAALVLGDFLETPWAFVPAQLSLELVALVAIAALLGWRGVRPRRWMLWLGALILTLAFTLRLADITVPWYFGREFNAVVDLRYLPFGLELMRGSMTASSYAAILGGAALAGLAMILVTRWLVEAAWRIGATRRVRPLAAVAAGAVLAFAFVPARYDLGPVPVGFSTAQALAQNAGRALDAWGITGKDLALIETALAARPSTMRLDGLKSRNVLLIFVESYGAITLTDPEFCAELAPTRRAWSELLPRAGYHVVSDVIDAPITGGGSWMAHASMNFGVRVDRQPLFDVLLTTGARPIGRDFRASGYRTIAAQPRMQQPWLQADFFGFDRVIDDAALAYRGPRFSWETSPDQFVLEQVHARELAVQDGQPRFVMFVLASTHAPFDRVPPIVGDGSRIGDGALYADLPVARFPPPGGRVFENRAGYAAAIRYTLDALLNFLTTRLDDDTLVIVLGDHQPPLNVAAATRSKAVPIHVLSRDRDLVAPFRAHGFVDGVEPARTTAERGMESFLGQFLAAFGNRRG